MRGRWYRMVVLSEGPPAVVRRVVCREQQWGLWRGIPEEQMSPSSCFPSLPGAIFRSKKKMSKYLETLQILTFTLNHVMQIADSFPSPGLSGVCQPEGSFFPHSAVGSSPAPRASSALESVSVTVREAHNLKRVDGVLLLFVFVLFALRKCWIFFFFLHYSEWKSCPNRASWQVWLMCSNRHYPLLIPITNLSDAK